MISFVILHYQALDETIDCVNTIFEKVKSDCKVVIVDNCSPNGSGTELEKKYANDPNVKVICTDSNLGFAKGNNIGYKAAKEDNPDFIVVMNNDVFIQQDDFAQRLEAAYNKFAFDVLGPDIFSTRDQNHQNPQRMKNYTLDELKKYQRKMIVKNKFKFAVRLKYVLLKQEKKTKKEKKFIEEPLKNVVLHGACYVFSKKYADKHENCFYDKTFMYFESYLLHFLAGREHLKLIYEPSIKVIHHEDVATNQTYKGKYQKSIFVNKCLMDSCGVFINAMKDESVKIG